MFINNDLNLSKWSYFAINGVFMAQPNLSSELLRTFIAVVEHGGFIKAADKLHKTQSTVSQQIKKLESESVLKVLEVRKNDYMVKKNVKGFYCLVEVQ